MIYIVDKETLLIKEIHQEVDYSITESTDLTGKTSITIPDTHTAVKGDYVLIPAANFTGIYDTDETEKDKASVKLNVLQKESLFDRKLILQNESLISATGIEDFIVWVIRNEFTASADTLLNYKNVTVEAVTHTKYTAKPETDDNKIYNFKTYLGNVMEAYGVCLDYTFTDGNLHIKVQKSNAETLQVDATVQDLLNYSEVFSVDVTAKVTVLATETGNRFTYYLLADRSTTTDATNANRAAGTVEIVTCQTDAEAQQAALDAFKSNSYQHNIEFQIIRDSKIFREQDFFTGRTLRVKTQKNGIYETFIKSISKVSDSDLYTVTCGNMPVTLIDKIKKKGVI